MILLYFLIATGVLAGGVLLLRNALVDFTFSILYVLLSAGLCAYGATHINETDSLYFKFDHLAVILNCVSTLVIIPVFYHTYFYLKRRKDTPYQRSLYLSSLMLLLSSMNATYFSYNLGLSWAFSEGTTLFLAVLIYHERHHLALEATWKYIFVSSIGIAFAFIGLLFLSVGVTDHGHTDFNILNLVEHAPAFKPVWIKVAFVLFLIGFSGKLGVFPFHTVGIDALAVAPAPITALVGSCLKCVGLVNIFRMYSVIAHTSAHDWANNVLILTGVISLLVAAVEMSKVRYFPRLLGYSSVEHMGILLICLGIGGQGYSVAILHIVLHSLAKAGFFLQMGQVHDIYLSNRIVKCGHYFKVYPFGAITVIFGLLTICAIPPSGLFVTEYLAFQTLFNSGHYLIAIIIMACLLIVLYYFTKDILYLLFNKSAINEPVKHVKIHPTETVSQWLLFSLVIILGYFPPPFLLEWMEQAVAVLPQ